MIKDETLKQIAVSTITSHESKYKVLQDKWEDLSARYENQLRAGSISDKTDSKIALGGAYALVENAIPRMLSRQPRFRYLARGREDSESAELYDEFSGYQWDESEAQNTLKKIAKLALIHGLAGWKMGWKEETIITKKKGKEILGRKVTNPIAMDLADKLGIGKNVKIDEENTIANFTLSEIKAPDLIWNVEAKGIKDVRVMGHKFRKTIKELKLEGYKVTEVMSAIQNTDAFRAKLENLDGVSSGQESTLLEQEEVEGAELYTKVLNDNGVYEYHIITTAQPSIGSVQVISVEKNPFDNQFIPMGIFRPIEKPEKFYGFGIIEPATGILDAEEDTINVAISQQWMSLVPPIEVQADNILDMDKLTYEPRSIMPVRRLGQSLAVTPTAQVNTNAVSYIGDFLQKSKQNVSAITDFQTGAEQVGGAKTLGEIQIKTQEANARLSMIMDAFEKEVIEPIGKYALWMNQQFLADNPKIIYRVVSRKGQVNEKPIKFKDIEAIKDVIVIAGSSALVAQQAEIQKWTLLLNQAYAEEKEPNPVPINKEAIWERLLEDGLLIKDVENFLPSVKEREEQSSQNKMSDMDHAKEENTNPLIARVMPTDTPQVHVPLHQAEIKAREAEVSATGQQDERKVEELQMLIQHLNDHVAQAGGAVPPHSAGMMVGQGINGPMANGPAGGAGGPQLPPQGAGAMQNPR